MINEKRNTIIVRVISNLITLVLVALMALGSQTLMIAFGKDYPFEEKYNLYQNYANTYVEDWNSDSIEDESIQIKQSIDEESITILVEGEVCEITAKYDIEHIHDSDNISNIRILKDSVTYEKHSKVNDILTYISILILIYIVFYMIIHALCYFAFEFIIFIINKSKKKKVKPKVPKK